MQQASWKSLLTPLFTVIRTLDLNTTQILLPGTLVAAIIPASTCSWPPVIASQPQDVTPVHRSHSSMRNASVGSLQPSRLVAYLPRGGGNRSRRLVECSSLSGNCVMPYSTCDLKSAIAFLKIRSGWLEDLCDIFDYGLSIKFIRT